MSVSRLLISLAILLAVCTVVPALAQPLAAPAAAPSVAADLNVAKAFSRAFAEVARKVTPTVVNISSTRVEPGRPAGPSSFFRGLFPDLGDSLVQPPRQVHSLGSGVILRPDGYIVTNSHVIQSAQQITVRLSATDTDYEAKLIGQDPYTDLAVIKIEATALPAAPLGDSRNLEVGEWVIAIGSPLGLAGTVTAGIVSAKGRHNLGITDYEDFIQTDAPINPGNSGGPLVNLDGEVIGINSAIASQGGGYDGVCFAIPSTVVRPVTDALIRDGKIRRPWVGILPKNLTPTIAKQLGLPTTAGVLVFNLVRDAPAHVAKLVAPTDVIVKWGARDVKDRTELSALIQATPPGTTVRVTYIRKGERQTTDITLGERPSAGPTKGIL